MDLRPYQTECLSRISEKGFGRWLVQMATGLGKTFVFSKVPRFGRTLILSHRDELVRQPIQYFDCKVGIEKAAEKSNGEEVVSASVQTLIKRLDKFNQDEFQTIITDEAHHCRAKSYQTIYDHFKPETHLGFTATPSRGDGLGLNAVFDEIIFSKDLRWGIENGYLSKLHCLRVNIGFDISDVATRMGDLSTEELEKAINIEGANKAIADACKQYGEPPMLVFCVSINHAKELSKFIPGSIVLTGESRDRSLVISEFKQGNIPILLNCALFTEGVDLPNIKTIIIARPTKSQTLYTQMVGRGTRIYPGKEKCILIDCVGVSGRHNLCTAPTLIGLSDEAVPEREKLVLEGDLLDQLPDLIERKSDCPESWIKNVHFVELFESQSGLNFHDINFFKCPDGSMYLGLGSIENEKHKNWRKVKRWVRISQVDKLGRVYVESWLGNRSGLMGYQEAVDIIYKNLTDHYSDVSYIWDRNITKRWENQPITDKQKELLKDIKINLNRGEAACILTRIAAKN